MKVVMSSFLLYFSHDGNLGQILDFHGNGLNVWRQCLPLLIRCISIPSECLKCLCPFVCPSILVWLQNH